uniref:Uncharacterized protein n=1 Tax=Meloidogyne enterolobii TaxID=390850 RepID=A0A6V7X640_MELEN|nr:unnamed protein product [Meloidogyne enterolobii]
MSKNSKNFACGAEKSNMFTNSSRGLHRGMKKMKKKKFWKK